MSNTLVRAALENTATGLWILGPGTRPERIERALRWHARNYHDLNYLRDHHLPAADMRKRNTATERHDGGCSRDDRTMAKNYR